MKVSVNCPECGVENPIPELATKESIPKKGIGTRPCVGCGVVFDWTPDELIVNDGEVKPISKLVVSDIKGKMI